MRLLPTAALLLAASALQAHAQADPLKSPACTEAIAALEQARAAGAPTATRDAARRQAVQLCLGGPPDAAPPPRVLRAPDTVAPPRPAPAPALPRIQPPAPPAAPGRPLFTTHCDAAGCWRSDGSYLPGLPAQPPPGCVALGAVFTCP
jgi:hypothetical protein